MRRSSPRVAASRKEDKFPTILQSQDLMAIVTATPPPPILELRSIVQFPIPKPGSASLSDFLDTFAHNTTTHTIRCSRHFTTGFSDEEFCRILRAFGRLSGLRTLVFCDGGDSRLRRLHLGEVADLLGAARQLEHLWLERYWLLTGNDGERTRLARALARHPGLRSFQYAGCGVSSSNHGSNKNQQQQQPLQLYQAIAPRADPDAVVRALASAPHLQSVRLTHSPYCARDYSARGLARLLFHVQELSVVTRVANWAPVLEQLSARHNDSEDDVMQHRRLVLTTCEHGLTCSADVLGVELTRALAAVRGLSQLSLRFWGGKIQPLRDTSLHLAAALRQNTSLRLLEVSDGGCKSEDDDDDCLPIVIARNSTFSIPPKKVILPSEEKGCLNAVDFQRLASALCENTNLQLHLNIGVAAVDQDALERLRIESNLNAVGRGRLMEGTLSADEFLESVGSKMKEQCRNDDCAFLQSCLFRQLRCNPLYWCHK